MKLEVESWYEVTNVGKVAIVQELNYGDLSEGMKVELEGTSYVVKGVERMGRQSRVGLLVESE